MPIPKEKELAKLYRSEFFEIETPDHLKNIETDIDWWNINFNDKYDIFEKKIKKNKKTILDIGSGFGHFLKIGKDRNWDVTGIEPSLKGAQFAKEKFDLEIINSNFDDELIKNLKKFDAIHLSEVLEHVPKPVNFLKNIYKVLNNNGLLCIEVPNDYNLMQESAAINLKLDPWWLSPPFHVNYFNYDSLINLLETNNFKVFLKESSFPLELFLLMGENYVDNDSLGRMCHTKRKKLEISLKKTNHNWLKRKLYQSFADIGIGRQITLYASKR